MERFLGNYLGDRTSRDLLDSAIEAQSQDIRAAIAADPLGSREVTPGDLHEIAAEDFRLDRETLEDGRSLVPLVRSILRVFHNARTSLHVPADLPPPVPTLPGPGRTDAFGVLAASFFGFPTKFEAPVKFGMVWNLAGREWVHWDGNSNEPLARNLGASLGLGAPMVGRGKLVNLSDVKRHTVLSESIRSPRFPFEIDRESAARGAELYRTNCASCHDGPGERASDARATFDARLFTPEEIGTDPNRARFFDRKQADLLNRWVGSLDVPGYRPPAESFRSTQKYWASDMSGVWARSPYIHNGSVRTLWDLLTAEAKRPRSFRRGSPIYDTADMGYVDAGSFVFDTRLSGNSNAGHNYGTELAESEKRSLIEFLKTQ